MNIIIILCTINIILKMIEEAPIILKRKDKELIKQAEA
jgi:hypothetical protein